MTVFETSGWGGGDDISCCWFRSTSTRNWKWPTSGCLQMSTETP